MYSLSMTLLSARLFLHQSPNWTGCVSIMTVNRKTSHNVQCDILLTHQSSQMNDQAITSQQWASHMLYQQVSQCSVVTYVYVGYQTKQLKYAKLWLVASYDAMIAGYWYAKLAV